MHRRRYLAVLVMAPLFGTLSADESRCGPLESCLQALVGVAKDGLGIPPEAQAIAKGTAKYGEAAVPGLVALLEHRRESVRDLAGYTVRSIEQVDAKYLPALMEAQRRESGWLPMVIGRIGTDEAMRFLVEELRREPEVNGQVGFAFIQAGAKSVPYLVPLFRCGRECDPDLLREAGQILGRLEPPRDQGAAVMPLLDVARDAQFELRARQLAIAAIGDIGREAAIVVPSLLELMRKAPELKDGAERAIIATWSPEAVPILLGKLPAARTGDPLMEGGVTVMSPIRWMDQPVMVLDTIGDLGPTARPAGVHVLPHLRSVSMSERVEAARTLGRIGYLEGRDALRQALRDPFDWRLVHEASEALGRLGDQAALGDLDRTAREYWFPRVRQAAARAAKHIRSGEREFKTDETRRVLRWADMEPCAVAPPAWTGPVGMGRKWTLPQDERELRKLQYGTQVIGFRPTADSKPNRSGVIRLRPDNTEMTVDTVKQVPHVAVEIEDGWLLGGSRGEFGGELVFQNSEGETEMLLDDNVEGIFRLGDVWLASAGLSFGRGTGALYRVARGADGHWAARPWRRLPGAPSKSWLLDATRLYVETDGGGSIVVHADGRMEMADCH